MKLNKNEEIEIKQVLMSGGKPGYVEFYSPTDSRTHIMNAERFCDVFGYTAEELNNMSNKTDSR